jgi:hypothetical protein
MICGPNSKTLWLLSALLLSVSLPLYSLPGWAVDLTEQEAKEALVECAMRLEITTNELESALNMIDEYRTLTQTQRILIADQSETIRERDNRLIAIGLSFNAYETAARRTLIRNTAIGFGIGAAAGAIVYSLLPF